MSIAEKLVTIAENQEKVYEAGKADERETFWENFQQGGSRKAYNNAFSYWWDACYNPIYPIVPNNAANMYSSSQIVDTKVPIDFTAITSSSNMNNVFAYSTRLTTINKIIVNENTTYTNWFPYCRQLQNITFVGTIGKSIDFSECPLTPESMVNIILHLAQYTGTEDAYKYTVKFNENCWSALESSEYDVHTHIAYGDTWRDGCVYLGWNT